MSTEFEQSGELRPGLFPEETAEEAVARIVAQNPQKHGVPLAEREHRMLEQARRIAAETQAFFDEDDNDKISSSASEVQDSWGGRDGTDADQDRVAVDAGNSVAAKSDQGIEGGQAAVGGSGAQPLLCNHSWPEDPDEETRCPLCQMTFADWVNT